LSLFNRWEALQKQQWGIPISVSYGLALALIFISLLGAPLLKKLVQPAHAQSTACVPGSSPISFKLNHGSYILLSSADNGETTEVPNVRLADVQRSFDDFPYGDFAKIMRKLKQPALIAVASDIATGQGMWIVAPAELKLYENQIISACAASEFATYPVMIIKSFANE
jgi:hypothetical protein